MNASVEWLRDFTDFDLTPEQLRDLLTSRCATVDELIPLRTDLREVVVARVVEVKRHPNSDHLWLARVDAGGPELLQVVCGAPNLTEGTLYPFAPAGSTLPGGLRLEKRKIRGETSNGMLCSARELGLGESHEGILALEVAAAPGAPLLRALPLGDTRLVLDVLPNRPDLLSHEGVAREIAAATGGELRRPEIPGDRPAIPDATRAERAGSAGALTLTLEDAEGCPAYSATVIRGVRVGPSPEWLVRRLAAVGVRSINNVVDVTNYMLHGFGQPMHAFDLGSLAGNELRIRRALPGEAIATLDGADRIMDASMTVIADAERAQAVAGVIGASTSEVAAGTSDVVLEAAVFDPARLRRTRRALGISTDASYRFERGVDASALESLARYAAHLITAVAGGQLDGRPLLLGHTPSAARHVGLRATRVATLLGVSLPLDRIAGLLASVAFAAVEQDGSTLSVTPPSWRSDVTAEVDLIEEVARLHGYDAIPAELRPFRPSAVPDSPLALLTARVADALVAEGLLEVRPMPFVADAAERGVRVRNPLAEDEAWLRSSVLDTLAQRVVHNFAQSQRNIRLFEIGAVFLAGGAGEITERSHVGVIVTGERYPAHFTHARPPEVDIWDVKHLAEVVAATVFGRATFKLVPRPAGDALDVVVDGRVVGSAGPVTVAAPVWAAPVFGLEIELPASVQASGSHDGPRYVPLPVTPAAHFDLALLVPEPLGAERVELAIRAAAGDLLEAIVLFDEFRGAGVPAGARSLAWRLTLRHPERTLRDREIAGRRQRILSTLEEELGVRQRAT